MTYVSFVYLEPTHMLPCGAGRCLNIQPNKLLSSPGYSDASKVVHKIAWDPGFRKSLQESRFSFHRDGQLSCSRSRLAEARSRSENTGPSPGKRPTQTGAQTCKYLDPEATLPVSFTASRASTCTLWKEPE